MSMHPHAPRPRVLVAFASRHGATREIAATVVRCLVDGGPRPGPGVQRLGALVGARDHRRFPGRLERRLLSSAERAVWCGGAADAGDFRDWPAVRNWAGQIADGLSNRVAVQLPGLTA